MRTRASDATSANLLSRLSARWGSALGRIDPRLFATKKRLVLDASRAAFHELDPPADTTRRDG